MTDFKKIKAFSFDVDGVFTDGGVLSDVNGEFYRTFDAKDGFAIRMATMHGYPVAIITGGRSLSIPARFTSCGVKEEDVYLKSRCKTDDFEDFCKRYNLKPEEVMFIGDDIPDIATIRLSGLGICPADAVQEVKEASDIVSAYPGGRGCVRNAVESVMKAQGTWTFDALEYKKLF